MNKISLTTKAFVKSGNARLSGAKTGLYSKRQGIVSDDQLEAVFQAVEQN